MLTALKNYANFNGRARRQEYWLFILTSFVIFFITSLIDGFVFGVPSIFTILGGLFLIIPSFSVSIRRLHDTGRSGWWVLIPLVPVIGGIAFFVFTVLDSTPGSNQFGQNPKGM